MKREHVAHKARGTKNTVPTICTVGSGVRETSPWVRKSRKVTQQLLRPRISESNASIECGLTVRRRASIRHKVSVPFKLESLSCFGAFE